MHTSEEAFESEAQAISILKQWALSSERDELEVGLLSDCLAARKDGTDFVPVPNYIWGLTSNDVVWELTYRTGYDRKECENPHHYKQTNYQR